LNEGRRLKVEGRREYVSFEMGFAIKSIKLKAYILNR
jgi:hypothetical protein